MIATLPEFDALARDANARKQVASASQPLAPRAVTWGSASPTVIARPAPPVGGQGFPGSAVAGSAYPGGYAQRPAGVPAPYPSAPGPGVAASPLPPIGVGSAVGIGDPALQPFPKVARQRPPPSEDWRDKIFSR